MKRTRSVLISLLMVSMVLSGCFGEEEPTIEPELELDETMNSLTAPRGQVYTCLLYTSPSPRDRTRSRMPSSA